MIARLVFLVLLCLGGVSADAACRSDRVTLRGDWGQAGFDIRLADDEDSRARGLMFVKSMPRFSGMLFVYEKPQRARFWMKNTLIPLDMIFIGQDGVVRRVHADAVPHDETMIDGGSGVLAVLEVNGGLAARLGIKAGSEAQHPAFGAGAAWPCD